ncbi:hypothetical protein E4U56_000462 [Claviceps arundinis]|uniref:Uncharacterized protein n=1 Tax=Claviceps arundinis TaxID=1623583 RepID=A0A9P7MZB2_9HYPO|nr:hypothetical protein E4U56_000462 [Claviceps arundinis]
MTLASMVQQLQHKVNQIQSQSLHIQHTPHGSTTTASESANPAKGRVDLLHAIRKNVRTAKLVLNGFENWYSTLSTSDTTGSTEADPGGGRENAALNPHPARVTRRWASASYWSMIDV